MTGLGPGHAPPTHPVPGRIRRDPYLAALARRHGAAAIEESGWFDDGDPGAPLDDVGWLCTPTHRVRAGLARAAATTPPGPADPAPVVLLATGAFHPFHDGHRGILEAARVALEAHGRTVVGGYVSPGHDDYLRSKRTGDPLPAAARLAGLSAALGTSGWLEVDPWEAQARRVPVTFTDVATRLQAYLRAWVHPGVEVVFVCGADNARFALAFSELGGCVVVDRPGAGEEWRRWSRDGRVARSGRVLFVPGDRGDASSRLPVPPAPDAVGHLRLRLEDARAVRTLGLPGATWCDFQRWLVRRLGRHLEVRTAPVPGAGGRPTPGSISLDPYRPGEVDLACSRLHDLGGRRQLGHVPRPGAPPLAEQVAALRPGRWTLVDDDTSTGGTVRFVRDQLPDGVLLGATRTGTADPGGELGDSRDLLLGTDDGGLVVELPDGAVGRAPYLLPYVDPSVRLGLPPGDAVEFSRDVWDRNAELFAGTDLQVRHLPVPARRTIRRAGHADHVRLAEVCARHASVLDRLL